MSILANIRGIFGGGSTLRSEISTLKTEVSGLKNELEKEQKNVLGFGGRDEITESRAAKRSPFSPYFLEFVPWGQFNLHPQTFKDLLAKSPSYSRICTSLSNMANSELIFEGDKNGAERYFEVIGINNKFIEKSVWDTIVFNAFSCQVIRDSSTNTPARVIHQRVENVRSGKMNEFLEIENYYLARDWSLINTDGRVDLGRVLLGSITGYKKEQTQQLRESYEVKKIPVFSPGTLEEVSLIYNYRYSPATNYYPVPMGEPAEDALKLQTKFYKYYNNQIDNGAAAGAVIFIPTYMGGSYEDIQKEMQKTAHFLKMNIGGIDKAGTPWLIPYEQGSDIRNNAPTIHNPPFDSNDKKYIDIIQQNRQDIFTSLGVISTDLYGISSPHGFSSQADMLVTAYELTVLNIIKPLQKLITEPLNEILKAGNISAEVEFNNELPFKKTDVSEEIDKKDNNNE